MVAGTDHTSTMEWRRHWSLLVPCLAGIMLCSVYNYSMGVMIGPLEREFGWSRAQIASGPSMIALVALIGSPLVGRAVDRYGPRPISLVGVIAFCGALALLSTTTADPVSWWFRWILLGIASMFIVAPVWAAAINRAFDRNRGIALAIALSGAGLGAAFVPALTNLLVESQGWRHAYVGLGLICGGIVFPLVFLLFRVPADGACPEPASPSRQAVPLRVPTPARSGFTSPSFLLLAAAAVLFSMAACVLTSNIVPILVQQGFATAAAAGVAGLLGLGAITGRIGGGLLLDRIDARKVGAISVVPLVVAVLLFKAFPGDLLSAGIGCFVLGLSVGAELDACAYLAGRHFGLANFGLLFGTINGLMMFTNGVAPVGANFIYDVTGSYALVLWTAIPLCLMTAFLFLRLGDYPALPRGDPVRQRAA